MLRGSFAFARDFCFDPFCPVPWWALPVAFPYALVLGFRGGWRDYV